MNTDEIKFKTLMSNISIKVHRVKESSSGEKRCDFVALIGKQKVLFEVYGLSSNTPLEKSIEKDISKGNVAAWTPEEKRLRRAIFKKSCQLQSTMKHKNIKGISHFKDAFCFLVFFDNRFYLNQRGGFWWKKEILESLYGKICQQINLNTKKDFWSFKYKTDLDKLPFITGVGLFEAGKLKLFENQYSNKYFAVPSVYKDSIIFEKIVPDSVNPKVGYINYSI